MPISGPVIHHQLMDGYKAAEARMHSLRQGRSNSINQKKEQLDNDREKALMDLAEHYLPELTRQAIRDTWIEVRSSIAQILLRKDDHCTRTRRTLDEWCDRRDLQNDKLTEVTQQLDEAITQREELAGEVGEKLRIDPIFVDLSDKAAVAEAALERAEANLNEIEQDATRKLPAYEDSSLFTYLRDRKFGTSDYTSRGLTRRVDRWLARFIDYRKAKQGYNFLKETPERMRQILAEDRDAFDTVMDEIERHQQTVAKRIGLPDKISAVERLQERRTDILSDLDSIAEKVNEFQHELTDLENPRGIYYREAIGVVRDMLEHKSNRDLERRARATPDVTDDQIVARLNGVSKGMAELEDSERQRQRELAEMQEFLDALGRMIQRFRAAEFDSSRSQFVGTFDVIDQLHRARTEYDVEEIWQNIRRAQRWGPTLGEKITSVATHPVTQVVISAMAQAAGAAMRDHARRAGRRRYRGSSGSWFGDSSGFFGSRR